MEENNQIPTFTDQENPQLVHQRGLAVYNQFHSVFDV
jgi:hypothetical protein